MRRPITGYRVMIGGLLEERQLSYRLAWSLIAALIFCTLNAAVIARELPDTIAAIKPSIVGVATVQDTRTPPMSLRGTGFAVGDGRYVVTNAHVVPRILDDRNHEYLAVLVGTGSQPDIRKAEQIAADFDHDLVLLKIAGPALSPLVIGDSSQVREGDRLVFTGFPIGFVLGLYPVTHSAMVSSITPIAVPMDQSRSLDPRLISQLRRPFQVFQLDATAYPGNSGSPLYRPDSGEVVGVINMVFVKGSREKVLADPSGISYAMPAQFIRELLARALSK